MKDGSTIPYLFTAVYFEKDSKRGFVGVAVDFSQRTVIEKELRTERDFSSAMLDSPPGIFYYYDHEMRLRRWNKNHELVTGYSAAELTNKNPLEFFAEAERELVASRIVDILGAGQSAVEANFMGKDGRTVPYLFTGVNLSHQDKANFVGIGIDISELKKAEKSRHEKTVLLEAQVESPRVVSSSWTMRIRR